MTSIAQLGLSIDSSQAKTGADNLGKMASSAKDAESATADVGKASEGAGEQVAELTEHVQRHVLSLLDVSEDTRAYIEIASRIAPPVLAAAAAFGIFTAVEKEASGIQNAFAASLAQSNNAAGTTVSILAEYADQIGRASGSTSDAAQALSALVSTGKVGTDSLKQIGQAALDANKAFSTSFDDTSKNFAALADAPIATLRSLGALTPALQAQIEALEGQGNAAGAAAVAQKAYAQQLEVQVQQFSQNESTWTKGWQTIKEAASEAWDAMTGLGRPATPQQNLTALQSQLAAAQKDQASGRGFTSGRNPTAGLQAQIKAAQAQVDAQNATAAAQAKAAADKLQADRADAAQQVLNAATIALSNIKLQASIQSVTDALALHSAAVQSDNSIVESLHSEGLISDQQYYDARRALILSDTAAQVAALNQQIALVKQQSQVADAARDQEIAHSRDDNTPQGAANTQSLISGKTEADAQTAARVAELQSQVQKTQIASSEQIVAVNTDQALSYQRVQQQIAQVAATNQLYVKGLTDQYNVQEASIGLSDEQAQRLTELTTLQQHFADQTNDIQRQQAKGTIGPDQATAEIAAINAAQTQATTAFLNHYQVIDAAQADWLNGAKKAFQDYQDAASNVAGLAATAFTTGFNDINTAIVNLVTTGKLNWKSLIESFLTDFAKFEVTILESKALAAVAGLFGLGTTSPTASAALGLSAAGGATTALDGLLGIGNLSTSASAALGASASSGATGALDDLLSIKKTGATPIISAKANAPEQQVATGNAPTVFNYQISLTSPQVSQNDVLAAMQQTQKNTVAKLQDMKRRRQF